MRPASTESGLLLDSALPCPRRQRLLLLQAPTAHLGKQFGAVSANSIEGEEKDLLRI